MKTLILVLAAVASMLAGSAAALAEDRIPQDVSVVGFERWMSILQMSSPQRRAARLYHATYQRRYADEWTSDVEPYLARRPPETMTTVAEMIEYLAEDVRRNQGLRRRLRRHDDALFATLETILSEEQLGRLAAVRSQRTRSTARVRQFFQMTGRPYVDLSDTYYELRLVQPGLQVSQAEVDNYERQLTAKVSKLHTELADFRLRVMRQIQAHGIEDLADQAPVFISVWPKVANRAILLADDVDRLNRTAAKRIADTLPPDLARSWLYHASRAVYPELDSLRRLREGLVDDLVVASDEEKAAIWALIDELGRNESQLRQAEDEAYRRASPWSESKANARRSVLEQIGTMTQIARDAIAMLPRQLADPHRPEWFTTTARVSRIRQGATLARVDGRFLSLRERLSLLGDYTDVEPCQSVIDRSLVVASRVLADDHDGSTVVPSPLSEQALSKLSAVEDRALDCLLAELPHRELRLARVRAMRGRDCLSVGFSPMGPASVDVAEILLTLDRSDSFGTEVIEVLLRYEADVQVAMRERLLSSRIGDADAIDATTHRIAQAAIRAVADLEQVMEPELAGQLRGLFRMAAYPLVLDDHLQADLVIADAFADTRLPDSAREELAAISQQYHEEYESMTEELIRLCATVSEWLADDDLVIPNTSIADMKAYKALARSRSELNARVRAQVKAIVTDSGGH